MAILALFIEKTSNVPILLGGETTFTVKISNVSENIKLYNLNIYLTLVNGMTIKSGTLQETTIVNYSDGGSKISWINLKDLAPKEVEYKFDITVKANTIFKNGQTIPFGYIFSGINVKCEMDTMPRGNYDIGNEKKYADTNMTFKAIRFYNTITSSSKVLKGGGTAIGIFDYTKIYTATFRFFNNNISTSNMNITILLENGIRYIGNITVGGTDGQSFLTPTVTYVDINGKRYIKIYYGNVTLTKNSDTTVNFKYAVWNRYNENTGEIIAHGSNLSILTNMSAVGDSFDNIFNFAAMDLIISTTSISKLVDIDDLIDIIYTYEVGGYYNLKDIDVDYMLPDGILYLSSSQNPYYESESEVLKGYELKYYFAFANMNSANTITIKGKVNTEYKYKIDSNLNKLPIVAFDDFVVKASILGTKIENNIVIGDSDSDYFSIKIPIIFSEFLNGYYRNGTIKNSDYLSPGDLGEYKLTYNATTLRAIQKKIYLQNFFPLCTDPINDINYLISGYEPIALPELISPHGVGFNYGNVPGTVLSTITYKVPIKYLGSTGEIANLFKLNGLNTNEISYSSRTQIDIKLGLPNIQLTKLVSGVNINSIKYGEVYNFTIKILNTNTLGSETDAFDFILSDEFSPWFNVNINSINITGSGSFGVATYDANQIQVPIYKLAPGNFVTLNYSVVISQVLVPGITITTKASNTNPYSQIYNNSLENFQYTNLNKVASTTLKSQNITINKVSNKDNFMVGSYINYTITVTVPIGTVAFDLYVKDILPIGNQIYSDVAFRNGVPITPTVVNNIITFQSDGYIDARIASQVIVYTIKCRIINGVKSIGSNTTIQNNTAQVLFKESAQSANWITISKTLAITVNYPNIIMNLVNRDRNEQLAYSSSTNALVNSIIDFKLEFVNNSKINLVNGLIEIPISNDFIFSTINLANGCNAIYNNGKIIISIDILQPSINRFVTFSLICLSNLRSGTTINTQSTAISYYNDISQLAVYGGEVSNICKTIIPSSISLLPDESDRVDDSTSYRVTVPGSTMTILNYLTNAGGGYDDYTLVLEPVEIPYTLYIDNVKIQDVPINTVFNSEINLLLNMLPKETRTIKIVSNIPESVGLGCRYNFVVTGKSKTFPYVEKTVLNIDPT